MLLEAPLRPFNAGAPGLAQYMAFMDARGFAVLDVYEVHHLEEAGTVTTHPTALQVAARHTRGAFAPPPPSLPRRPTTPPPPIA